METLAIIPARGGSIGLHQKNIRIIANKPLIKHTINVAKKSRQINRIIVSTDDKKIVEISRKAGAEIPFLRPKKLSKNSTTTLQVVKHTINTLYSKESYRPDIIIVLQPTSPKRTSLLIDQSIMKLKKTKASCVLTVAPVKTHPKILFSKNNYLLKPMVPNFEKYTIRQKRNPLYYPTGSIYTFWYKTLSHYNSIYGNKIVPMIITDESLNLDIDTPFDFFLSDMTLKYWEKYKKKF